MVLDVFNLFASENNKSKLQYMLPEYTHMMYPELSLSVFIYNLSVTSFLHP